MVRNAKVLFFECTYIDDKRPVERARKWGHTHLYEIAKNEDAFKNVEMLYLMHISPRYSKREVQKAFRDILPKWLLEKTVPVF